MKTINAKRIAAVAASLLMGLAFAGTGGVTWSNIPIISNQGQPVVQVVVGSTAWPSDGVVAANIAAVLGNLAFTSVNVTAQASGLSNVNCVVTTPTCSLTNQQVWFNERGFATPSGSYGFTALIGSVLNGAVQLGSPSNTKSLQTGTAYTYAENSNLQTSPVSSPFTQFGVVPTNQTATGLNSGGWKSNTFTSGGQDNILEVTPAQLPGLVNNWGTYGETSNIWLTGFPVYNQQTGSNLPQNFAVLSAGAAYQVVFNKPIPEPFIAKGNSINNAAIQFLGQNWTILNYTTPSGSASTTTTTSSPGTKLSLAQTLTPISTIYVGHNISSGGFTVSLTDLGQPNSSGISQASVNVYYNGTLTNTTQLQQFSTTKFQVGAHSIYVRVNTTFAGLYAYQKWAKMQLYSNLLNITDNSALNKTNANGWTAFVLWTNGTTSSGKANELQSIVLVNQTPKTLWPGTSLGIVTPNMTKWKVTFVGDTLGNNYDPVTFSLSSSSNVGAYQNLGTQSIAAAGSALVSNLTSEPAQLLTVSSQIPNAFSFAGQTGSTVTYDLTPYKLNEVSTTANTVAGGTSSGLNVIISSTVGDSNIINSNSAYTITVKGYTSTGLSAQGTAQITSLSPTGSATAQVVGSTTFFNVTQIYANRALPYITINVVSGTGGLANTNTLATLTTSSSPAFIYSLANQNYDSLTVSSGGQATYNQQNGQPSVSGGLQVISQTPLTGTAVLGKSNPYYTVNMIEYDVPGSTSFTDNVVFGIYNATANGAQNFGFQLNQSGTGTRNNVTYVSSQGNSVNAPPGFVTERGTKFASVSPSSLTLDVAKVVDTLQFVVGPVTTVAGSNVVTTASVGPVGVGQEVPGFANLTVSKVNATCAFSSTSCSVTGLSNLTATPSVSQAVVPVSLNTATTPIAVLDSNANSAATLILVGSKYVNSVSAQVFAQNPSLNSSFGPGSVVVSAEGTNRILVAGYTANQTVTAGNQFINDLLQAAGTP